MKIATMADAAEDEEQKKKLSTLADNVVATLEAVVERTTEKLDEASEVVQDILKKAAEENGEFALPLKAERLAEMRAEVRKNADSLDEGVISTIFAYMKKANEDGLDGMVLIFQKVLQLYASEELLASKPGDKVLEELLAADSDAWDGILARAMGGETDKDTLLGSVQRSVEKVVLQKASGSYGQRVQAEFLRELMGRIRAADEAQGGGSTSGDAEA
jgi:energy-converting hydrogenase A subunit M